MFGIVELKDRVAAIEATIKGQSQLDRSELRSMIEVSGMQTKRLTTVEMHTDKIATRVSDEARRNDETRTQVARLAKMLSEVVERQSKLSEDLMELDRKVSKAVSFASQPVGGLTFERHEVTAKKPASEETLQLKPQRVRHRKTWPARYSEWLRTAPKSDVIIVQKALKSSDPEGVRFNHSLIKAAFGVGLCDWLRRNDLKDLPRASSYEQASGPKRFKVTIPDLQNPKWEPVNFGLESKGDQMRAERQWTRLARFVKAELIKQWEDAQ